MCFFFVGALGQKWLVKKTCSITDAPGGFESAAPCGKGFPVDAVRWIGQWWRIGLLWVVHLERV